MPGLDWLWAGHASPTHASALSGLGRAAPFLLLAVLALAVRAFLPRTQQQPFLLVRELLVILPTVLLYFVARGLADARPEEAFAHATRLISLERQLGIFREPQVQALLLLHPLVVNLADWIYMFGHWPVIIATLVWLGHARPKRLPLYRNALIISGVIGIVFFLTYPVAPPRFMSTFGFSDTVGLHSRAYRILQPAALTDLFASMPSLHVGWNLLMGIALARESTHPATRAFGILMPFAMFAAVVVTANHYFLDGVVGASLVLISLAAASRIASWRGEGGEAASSASFVGDRSGTIA
jgi:hypothetical protein